MTRRPHGCRSRTASAGRPPPPGPSASRRCCRRREWCSSTCCCCWRRPPGCSGHCFHWFQTLNRRDSAGSWASVSGSKWPKPAGGVGAY
jgi:hypothetical protein